MSNAGQAVLSVGGALVGAYFGNPQLGFQLGLLAGGALFPTDLGTLHGPRLDDLRVQTSTIGAPIPLIYGTYAVSGNVIWSAGIEETVTKKKQGGKGGSTQTTKEYSYSVSCAVGVCEGPISGILRIWADSKLIYDTRPIQGFETQADYSERLTLALATLNSISVYTGTEDQLPDTVIESYEGVGNVSGFRGLAYVVFRDFQLEEYGNRIPNFRFEIAAEGAQAQVCTDEWSNAVLYPWLTGDDPRNPLNEHQYKLTAAGADTDISQYQGPTGWVTDISSITGASASSSGRNFQYYYGFSDLRDNLSTNRIAENYALERVSLHLDFQLQPSSLVASYQPWYNNLVCAQEFVNKFQYVFAGQAYQIFNRNYSYTGLGFNAGKTTDSTFDGALWDSNISCGIEDGVNVYTWWKYSRRVEVQRTIRAPLNTADDPAYETVPYVTGIYRNVSTGQVVRGRVWTYDDSTTYKVLQQYATANEATFPNRPYVSKYPLNPTLPLGHANYNDQAFWEAAYADAVAAGDMAAGLTYGVHYPKTQSWAYSSTCEDVDALLTLDGPCVTLAEIVADLCERAGLLPAQIDTTDLTECVDGYVIPRAMSVREAVEPLRGFGFFDCVESAGTLKWPTRGKPSVATLSEDELAARWADSGQPSSVEISRSQIAEIPYRVRIKYAQVEMWYEQGEQSASRISTDATQTQDVELAIAMSDVKAARIAEVFLRHAWTAQSSYRFSVGTDRLVLEPGDPILLPVEGRVQRVRITDVSHTLPGLLTMTALRDDDGVYTAYAQGTPAGYPVGGGGSVASIAVTDLTLLDLPLLRDADNDAGYYAAARAGVGSVWNGAVIYRSPDGGVTFDQVVTVDSLAVVGTVDAALPVGTTFQIDTDSTLVVTLEAGDELESITQAQLLAGLNAAAVGADGRWEIIQFMTATPDSSGLVWTLTDFLRGRRGTEWAVGTGLAGDTFVLLDSSIVRVPSLLSGVGSSREHRAVSYGLSLETTTGVSFTGRGVALEPFSVVDVVGERDAGDLIITWTRRGRIGSELPDGADIALSEESEAYEVDILDDALSPAVVLRTLYSSVPTVTYTEAQQVADFGSPVPNEVTVRIYQMSASVGRGYAAEATL